MIPPKHILEDRNLQPSRLTSSFSPSDSRITFRQNTIGPAHIHAADCFLAHDCQRVFGPFDTLGWTPGFVFGVGKQGDEVFSSLERVLGARDGGGKGWLGPLRRVRGVWGPGVDAWIWSGGNAFLYWEAGTGAEVGDGGIAEGAAACEGEGFGEVVGYC